MAGTATATGVWQTLAEGHERFAGGSATHPHQDLARRTSLAEGQHPVAAVLGCSDSRVPPELVFDVGLGDLFVVRTAGQAVDGAALGSLEYGITALGAPLLVVLGHSSCGAVTAARQSFESGALPGGSIDEIVARLTPVVIQGEAQGTREVDGLVNLNVRHAIDALPTRSPLIREALEAGSLALVGATYNLAEGSLSVVATAGDVATSATH